jgi:hypothetical protein
MSLIHSTLRLTLVILALAAPAAAQQRSVISPGMPQQSSGQLDRFSRDFNPAISLAFDAVADYLKVDGDSEDGFGMEMRTMEVLAAAWVDPSVWVYATVASEGSELSVEEASLQYLGLGDAYTLRVGRFFSDFGKQMQAHVHDLRTIERPLVLREYLGSELTGDGVQFDHWLPVGDETLVRYSVGAFQDLSQEEPSGGTLAPVQADRKKAQDLNFTGRLTALRDAGTNGQVQLGASTRVIPQLAYEDEQSGDSSNPSSNVVWGLDFTYGWVDDTAISSWTFGGEWLMADGALSADYDTGTSSVDVYRDTATGFYAFVDHGLNIRDSIGLQFSQAELTGRGAGTAKEYDAYFTRMLSEFFRLRFAVTYAEYDNAPDSVRAAIQLVGFVGPHDHGVNW